MKVLCMPSKELHNAAKEMGLTAGYFARLQTPNAFGR